MVTSRPRLDVAEQGSGHRVPSLLARQARPQDGVDVLEPGHEHRRGRVDHHDRPRCSRGDAPDEFVLSPGQRQRGLVRRLGLLLIGQPDDDHGDVRGGGRPLGIGDHGAGLPGGWAGDQGIQGGIGRPGAFRGGAGERDTGLYQGLGGQFGGDDGAGREEDLLADPGPRWPQREVLGPVPHPQRPLPHAHDADLGHDGVGDAGPEADPGHVLGGVIADHRYRFPVVPAVDEMAVGGVAEKLRARLAGVGVGHETRPGHDRTLADLNTVHDRHRIAKQRPQAVSDADLMGRVHPGRTAAHGDGLDRVPPDQRDMLMAPQR